MPSVFLPRHYHYTAVCVQYLLYHLCFFPATASTPQSLCSRFLKPPVSSQVLPINCTLFVQYLLCPVFLPRHYQYTAVYFCSVFTVPSVFLPRHYQYSAVYLCSLFTVPCSFPCTTSKPKSIYVQYLLWLLCSFPGTTTTLQYTCAEYFPCPLCYLPGTTSTLKSTCVEYLLCPLCSFPGTTSTVQSICAHYLLCPVLSHALPVNRSLFMFSIYCGFCVPFQALPPHCSILVLSFH
jgi:hypothetical protein